MSAERLTEKPIEGVAFIVFDPETKETLLQQRVEDPKDPFSGLTLISGGHIEEGETAPYAVVREMREELGVVKVRGCRLLGTMEILRGARMFVMHFFLMERNKTEIINASPEEGEQIWVSWEKAQEIVSLDSNRVVLKLAEKVLTDKGLI